VTIKATFECEGPPPCGSVDPSLTINEPGNGSGTVECEVEGGGLESCPSTVTEGSTVKVVAQADTGSTLDALTGAGSAAGECAEESATEGSCEFEITEASEVTAEFNLESMPFSVNQTGEGDVECEDVTEGGGLGSCEPSYLYGHAVKVVAQAESSWELESLTGAGSAAGECAEESATEGSCEFEITEASEVDAVFNLIDRTLTINQGGTGSGVVECEVVGSGIEEACQPTYPDGTDVIVIAFEEPNSEFVEWTGASDCDAVFEIECEVTMDEDKTVEVVFDLEQRNLTVNTAGSGSGSVSCDGGACALSYPHGAEVTLTASATSGSSFAGWSGGGCSGTGACAITIEADTTVTATFDAEASPPPAPPPPVETCLTNPALCKPGSLIANGVAFVKGNKALLKVRCRGEQGARCRGALKLIARVNGGNGKGAKSSKKRRARNLAIGMTRYNLPTNSSVRVIRAKLTAKGRKLVRQAGRRGLKVKLVGKNARNRAVKLKQRGGGKKRNRRRASR